MGSARPEQTGWNLGDILDEVGASVPGDHPALIHGERVITRAALDRRSNALARAMANRAIAPGDKVGFYLRNGPEYMELLAACLRGRFTHVNVNYRYKAEELRYIFENSEAKVVAYDRMFRPLIEEVAPLASGVKLWVEVEGDGPDGPAADGVPGFADRYEGLIESESGAPLGIGRDPADPILIYTGGTTGLPKGVIWTHDILMRAQLNSLQSVNGIAPPDRMASYLDYVTSMAMHVRQLPAAPLMHATGMTVAMGCMVSGGCVVTLPGGGFDPDLLWQTVDKCAVTTITIVGDAFAKPMLKALDAGPGRYRLDTVKGIVSSGVMWSAEVKRGLLNHLPGATLLDSFGSTEAPACGASITTSEGEVRTSEFRLSEECQVFDENDDPVPPGSDRIGYVARAGNVPLGYFKDEEKTRRTFREIGGVRYVIPGDMCKVTEDGRLILLGRNSACINTGGEKVFSEEVEEILKPAKGVEDAIVVGIPDERWGQAVVAVVTPERGAALDEEALRDHVRGHLADYKVPKRIVFRDRVSRFPNGKADYKGARAFAIEVLGVSED